MSVPAPLMAMRMAYDLGQAAAGSIHRTLRLYRHVISDSYNQAGLAAQPAGILVPVVTEIGLTSMVTGSMVPPYIKEQKCGTVFVGWEHAELLISLPRSWSLNGRSGGYEVADLEPRGAGVTEFYYSIVNTLSGLTQVYKKSSVHEYNSTKIELSLTTVA